MTNRLGLSALWRREFAHYDLGTFRQDVLAGITVGAVALPLALAFGVASGATAAAGLVTAIIGGLVIGALSGAPYQISGPTGAMSAILIVLSQRYGLEAMWLTGVLAGVILLAVGALRLGRVVAFIPAPVITGFTAGVGLIIVIGQIDNLLGVATPPADSPALKLLSYFRALPSPNWNAVVTGIFVIATMLAWPRRLATILPGSLAGIVLASGFAALAGWDVPRIGEIPRTLLLAEHLRFADFEFARLGELAMPAISIAALGAIESLLCGAVASKMTGVRLHTNQELIAQGVGNLLIPFLGGVPATAAIARTSVGIKSGGRTRMVSIVHALVLLASALAFGPLIGRIPLAALAGVLVVTAVRMNEWPAIHFIFSKRFKSAAVTFAVTLVATIALDLSQAILVGVTLSAIAFLNSVANLEVTVEDIDPARLRERGMDVTGGCPHVRVAYITGPLFFAATNSFHEAFAREDDVHVLILSMRGVPMIDVSGLEALTELHHRLRRAGRTLMLCGVNDPVLRMMERASLTQALGENNVFWSAEYAIREAEARRDCPYCAIAETTVQGSQRAPLRGRDEGRRRGPGVPAGEPRSNPRPTIQEPSRHQKPR